MIMSKFIRLKVSSKICKDDIKVDVVKYQKNGTKRTFWTPEIDSKRITKTMFSSLWEAENTARKFIEFKLAKEK